MLSPLQGVRGCGCGITAKMQNREESAFENGGSDEEKMEIFKQRRWKRMQKWWELCEGAQGL